MIRRHCETLTDTYIRNEYSGEEGDGGAAGGRVIILGGRREKFGVREETLKGRESRSAEGGEALLIKARKKDVYPYDIRRNLVN